MSEMEKTVEGMETEKNTSLIIGIQVLICAVYVTFLFLGEARALYKGSRKLREAQAKEKIRYQKLKYKKKRKKLKDNKMSNR